MLFPLLAQRSKSSSGFSILEVLITAAIIGLLTAVIMVRYGAFNNEVLLKSQAYELALDLREAQSYAVSVRGSATEFREDYGLYFSMDEPDQYRLFRDNGDNSLTTYYDPGEEIGQPYYLDARFQIERICVNDCTETVQDLSVSFRRPDFDAQFASEDTSSTISNARIELSNINDNASRQAVMVSPVGQIYVIAAPAGEIGS